MVDQSTWRKLFCN